MILVPPCKYRRYVPNDVDMNLCKLINKMIKRVKPILVTQELCSKLSLRNIQL